MKITPLKLTEQERDFLKLIGEGSLIEGVRQAIAACGFSEQIEDRKITKPLKKLLKKNK